MAKCGMLHQTHESYNLLSIQLRPKQSLEVHELKEQGIEPGALIRGRSESHGRARRCLWHGFRCEWKQRSNRLQKQQLCIEICMRSAEALGAQSACTVEAIGSRSTSATITRKSHQTRPIKDRGLLAQRVIRPDDTGKNLSSLLNGLSDSRGCLHRQGAAGQGLRMEKRWTRPSLHLDKRQLLHGLRR